MAAALIAALLVVPAAAQKGEVIARINGTEITQEDLDNARAEIGEELSSIPAEDRRWRLVQYLIESRMMADAAKKQGFDETPEFKKRLDYYRDRALRDLYMEKKVRSNVTEAQAKALYDEQIAKMEPQTEIRARHVLVETESEALDVVERHNRGEDFAELARELSKGPSGADGGDLGYLTKGQLVKAFEETAFGLEKGEVSDPVKTEYGWHVIKLEDKRQQTPPDFKEVKEQLMSVLVRQEAEKAIGELRKESEVEIVDPAIKKEMEDALKRRMGVDPQ